MTIIHENMASISQWELTLGLLWCAWLEIALVMDNMLMS